MKFNLRSLFLGSCALVLGCTAGDPADTEGEAVQPIVAAVGLGATPVAVNASGIPHLLRGSDAMPAIPAATATESARQHLARLAPAWGVRGAARMPQLDALGEVPVRGGTIVRFRQVIDGLPVEPTAGGEMRVLVRGDGALVAASGVLIAADAARGSTAQFVDHDDTAAVARAVGAAYKTTIPVARLARGRDAASGAATVSGQSGAIHVSLSRAHQAWIPQGTALTPAWVVEAYSSNHSTDGDAYRTVISASGKVLSRTNLKADAAFKYRVYAETTGEFHPFDGPEVDSSPNMATPQMFPQHRAFPAYRPANLISVDGTNHPAPAGTAADPWLAAGATMTQGNNVDAYTDAHPPDGLTDGDFRADATAAGVFDRTYDFTKSAVDSVDQQKTGITSLFYLINWMHDFWYDGGFNEAAGNGQLNNYGRGGMDKDPVLAEAQDNALGPDGGSRNNANMATQSDGMS
ncbi:MAG TPA: M36 family metallopeptidase, partial [Kofleriaceae bacterium]